MERIVAYIESLSQQTVIGAVIILILVLGALIWHIAARHRFLRLLEEATTNEQSARTIAEHYSAFTLRFWSGLIVKQAGKHGSGFLHSSGIAELWIARFSRHPSRRLLRWLLTFVPDKALFTVFLVALRNSRITEDLLTWIEKQDDMYVYRRLALSGRGEEFDGARARDLFAHSIDRIREMTGDPEWPARYMAVKILLYDVDERSKRAVREMFHDPHPLIRRILIEEFLPKSEEENEEFYNRLLAYLTDDSAFEVRASAKERLRTSFSERYEIDFSALSAEQALHVLEQLEEEVAEDINLALSYLDGEDLELRFAAAQFLQHSGHLTELLLEVDFEDREHFDRNENLLMKAAEVNILGFLQNIRNSDNPASLLIALDILCSKGDESLITVLAEKVFQRRVDLPYERQLLERMLQCIRGRGTVDAVTLLVTELKKRRYQGQEATMLLQYLPPAYARHTIPALVKLLKDPDFGKREALHEAFLQFDPSLYLDEIFSILKAGRDEYHHSVRISALLLLGKLKLTYCMQFILEQMPVLPFSEARNFSLHLHDYAGKLFTERVMSMLEKDDGKVRAALISSVPSTGIKEFLKPIRQAVGDADPEVRRASVWALLEYGDQKSVSTALDLLRDPVQRVRVEAGQALASRGSASVLDNFEEILGDDNEVEPVKSAVIEGLAFSEEPKSVDILVDQLRDRPDDLPEAVKDALEKKHAHKSMKRLVERLKDADPELRDGLIEAFRRMGEEAETPLLELLHEDIASLAPHISYILEQTGYVEHAIRQLNHRDPTVRRTAADNLSRIGTTAAFRGIVLASRDPDDEVRVMVTRALERLNNESGNEILEELKNDPDKRIRKYTLWALERSASKNSE